MVKANVRCIQRKRGILDAAPQVSGDVWRWHSRHQFKQGDILAVKEITGEVIFIAEINQIQMIDFQHLTEDDAQALRYRDLAEFKERRQAMLGRKAWLFRITVLEETALE